MFPLTHSDGSSPFYYSHAEDCWIHRSSRIRYSKESIELSDGYVFHRPDNRWIHVRTGQSLTPHEYTNKVAESNPRNLPAVRSQRPSKVATMRTTTRDFIKQVVTESRFVLARTTEDPAQPLELGAQFYRSQEDAVGQAQTIVTLQRPVYILEIVSAVELAPPPSLVTHFSEKAQISTPSVQTP